MRDNLLECLEREAGPGESPVGSVIWMHGLGADATDFIPIVEMLELNARLRFVFPNAPVRPVTINGGMTMRAWYDIDPSQPRSGDEDIRESARQIAALVAREAERGIKADSVVLAGFSQGGVIALHLGLRHDQSLRGILALSTYLHDHERLQEELSLDNAQTPIFLVHGVQDPMIPITRAVTAREALTQLNYSVEWHDYPMGHEVCHEEIADIGHWLNQRFA
ncbi:MAG: alpha/beta hydrolase [Pseudomonadota bacterium]